jgi:protein-S-isoprenylcysteine O-methyltransferase Ste14
MYLAALLLFAGCPILLGSLDGLLDGIFLVCLLARRILCEEKLFIEDQDVFVEYKKRVKYRLKSFIW